MHMLRDPTGLVLAMCLPCPNRVDWYPWGQEAFDKARAEDKPIFLSVGYSTCHW
jgi:uncharacterized protein YyaL (SSP411 family)